jgi:hypothetical protein
VKENIIAIYRTNIPDSVAHARDLVWPEDAIFAPIPPSTDPLEIANFLHHLIERRPKDKYAYF